MVIVGIHPWLVSISVQIEPPMVTWPVRKAKRGLRGVDQGVDSGGSLSLGPAGGGLPRPRRASERPRRA